MNQRFGEAQKCFIIELSTPGNSCMRVAEHRGFEAAQRVIAERCAGRVASVETHIVRLG